MGPFDSLKILKFGDDIMSWRIEFSSDIDWKLGDDIKF